MPDRTPGRSGRIVVPFCAKHPKLSVTLDALPSSEPAAVQGVTPVYRLAIRDQLLLARSGFATDITGMRWRR